MHPGIEMENRIPKPANQVFGLIMERAHHLEGSELQSMQMRFITRKMGPNIVTSVS